MSEPASAAPSSTVVVRPTNAGVFQQIVEAGGHEFLVDEPASVGGRDGGPTPYDLLLASLGACTSMTMRLYAERKSLPLQDVKVTLSHRRVHAADCADCETGKGMLDEITRQIELAGPLDEAQRTRLIEIAEMCPVHRTLEGRIRIRTVLAD